ncbi:hypothetical protein PR048_016294 [Dryococelus australis]|uniref:TGF-beta propeptide domain-containing protein n=1 Tax=Dryococelus australis TaxID=614101 RepID=A0ABQ9HJM3_9NEOP|nr:hypothetical protein PR048_016294 [Dryococelus australis]
MQAVVWACVVAACGASLSGFYGDDVGGGQTVLRHALTSSERLQLEYEMLSLLGLRTRPRAATNLTSSASVFLLAVYDYKNHLPATGFQLSARDRRAVDRSDAVVSFAGRGESVHYKLRLCSN